MADQFRQRPRTDAGLYGPLKQYAQGLMPSGEVGLDKPPEDGTLPGASMPTAMSASESDKAAASKQPRLRTTTPVEGDFVGVEDKGNVEGGERNYKYDVSNGTISYISPITGKRVTLSPGETDPRRVKAYNSIMKQIKANSQSAQASNAGKRDPFAPTGA